eukprot:CAMPEP_0203748180 /NCGR_PEP_ID=MMETSP0098-20131031/3121_1 /ASSEMBLY_ACC=CAM_ASM_000208 /TAXON_ID=96639 /ORGANISM=" , Strain NY0313808BC1" /LENGTH=559 /DNA_ID=CAMNT_0050636825 /DNA_START=129 /DNA_END=1808 /DNA_ORIENTATION=+
MKVSVPLLGLAVAVKAQSQDMCECSAECKAEYDPHMTTFDRFGYELDSQEGQVKTLYEVNGKKLDITLGKMNYIQSVAFDSESLLDAADCSAGKRIPDFNRTLEDPSGKVSSQELMVTGQCFQAPKDCHLTDNCFWMLNLKVEKRINFLPGEGAFANPPDMMEIEQLLGASGACLTHPQDSVKVPGNITCECPNVPTLPPTLAPSGGDVTGSPTSTPSGTPAPTATGSPSTAAPSTAAPTATGSPSTDAPTATGSPTTGAPSTAAPTATGSPTTGAPSTAAPTATGSPTTAAPSTAAPTATGSPTTDAPSTAAPTATGSPTTAAPSTAPPTATDAPTTAAPSTAPPTATDAPTTGAPSTAPPTATEAPTTAAPSTAPPTATMAPTGSGSVCSCKANCFSEYDPHMTSFGSEKWDLRDSGSATLYNLNGNSISISINSDNYISALKHNGQELLNAKDCAKGKSVDKRYTLGEQGDVHNQKLRAHGTCLQYPKGCVGDDCKWMLNVQVDKSFDYTGPNSKLNFLSIEEGELHASGKCFYSNSNMLRASKPDRGFQCSCKAN